MVTCVPPPPPPPPPPPLSKVGGFMRWSYILFCPSVRSRVRNTDARKAWNRQSISALDTKADYVQYVLGSIAMAMYTVCLWFCCSCFRLSDLEVGEVIGQGFFGSVTKVRNRLNGVCRNLNSFSLPPPFPPSSPSPPSSPLPPSSPSSLPSCLSLLPPLPLPPLPPSSSLPPFLQVKHMFTGQVMVMKEVLRCTDEAKRAFMHEVGWVWPHEVGRVGVATQGRVHEIGGCDTCTV